MRRRIVSASLRLAKGYVMMPIRAVCNLTLLQSGVGIRDQVQRHDRPEA